MPLPQPNLYPPFNIVRLSHAELVVTDLSASRTFYADTLGLQVSYEDSERIYLRAMEERGHHCIALVKGDKPLCNVLGYKVYSEADLDNAAEFFADKGIEATWIDRPHMGRTLRTTDAQGIPIEFYFKMDRLAPIHQHYKLYRGVKPLRIDHFNCFSTNVDEAVAFYNDIGFRVTEYTEDEKSGRLWVGTRNRVFGKKTRFQDPRWPRGSLSSGAT